MPVSSENEVSEEMYRDKRIIREYKEKTIIEVIDILVKSEKGANELGHVGSWYSLALSRDQLGSIHEDYTTLTTYQSRDKIQMSKVRDPLAENEIAEEGYKNNINELSSRRWIDSSFELTCNTPIYHSFNTLLEISLDFLFIKHTMACYKCAACLTEVMFYINSKQFWTMLPKDLNSYRCM